MTDIIKNGTMIIPTAETIEQNKALVQKAVEQVAEWFSDHPGHFQAMAETIGQMNQDYEKEYERLNPPLSPEESNNWPHTGRKEKKPDLFNPIHACYGKPLTQQRPLTYQTERITRYSRPPKDRLAYYALLIGLHDGTAIIRGFPDPISRPKNSLRRWCEWLVKGPYCPEMMDDDRAAFVSASLLAVKNDLDTLPQIPPAGAGKDVQIWDRFTILNQQILFDEQDMGVSGNKYQILEMLIKARGTIVLNQQLEGITPRYAQDICEMKKSWPKLCPCWIENVTSTGYKLRIKKPTKKAKPRQKNTSKKAVK